MSLPSLISAKLKELELTPTAAAQKFGIAYPSFSAVAAGESQPNARTFKKYAKLLGISADKVEEMVAAAKGSGKAKKGSRRGPGRPPGKRGPGRPPGRAGGRRGGLVASLQDALRAAAEAEAVLADDLALAVHRLDKRDRLVVESVVTRLG